VASFAGITIRERPNGDGYPTWDKRDILAIKPRPNDDPIIQEIGMDVQRLALAVELTGAQLASLYDQVLESGSLVMNWETHNAFLESISPPQRIGVGNDLYLAVLNLVRL
jgi:hypothetical protein